MLQQIRQGDVIANVPGKYIHYEELVVVGLDIVNNKILLRNTEYNTEIWIDLDIIERLILSRTLTKRQELN